MNLNIKKNIVLVLTMQPFDGGKYQYCLTFIEALQKISGIEITALYYDDAWASLLPENFNCIRVERENKLNLLFKLFFEIFPGGIFILRNFSKYFIELQKKIFEVNPDYVIYPGNENSSYQNKFKSICPVFDIMHKYEKFPEISSFKLLFLRNLHYERLGKFSNILFFDSKLGKEQFIDNYKVNNKCKLFVLPYIRPNYTEALRDIEIEKLNKQLPEKFIFYPAQFWAHKNHIKLINAVHILNNQFNIDVSLVLVGAKKNNYEKTLSLIQAHNLSNKVMVLDYVSNEELVYLYKKAYCLVMASLLGPTNIPQLEAIGLGCPVFVSDVYASREQLGDAAIYFDPNDSLDLANKIRDLFNSNELRENLIFNGFKRDNKYGAKDFLKIIETAIK